MRILISELREKPVLLNRLFEDFFKSTSHPKLNLYSLRVPEMSVL